MSNLRLPNQLHDRVIIDWLDMGKDQIYVLLDNGEDQIYVLPDVDADIGQDQIATAMDGIDGNKKIWPEAKEGAKYEIEILPTIRKIGKTKFMHGARGLDSVWTDWIPQWRANVLPDEEKTEKTKKKNWKPKKFQLRSNLCGAWNIGLDRRDNGMELETRVPLEDQIFVLPEKWEHKTFGARA